MIIRTPETPEAIQRRLQEREITLLNPPSDITLEELRGIAEELNEAIGFGRFSGRPYFPIPHDVLSVVPLNGESYAIYRGTIKRADGFHDGLYLIERMERVRQMLEANISAPETQFAPPPTSFVPILETLEELVAQAGTQ